MKGSDKPFSPIAKVFIYIGIVLAVLLAIVLICIAIMFFVPGTTILGYQYVKYANNYEYKFTPTTAVSISSVVAVEVETKSSDIYVYPNTEDDEIKIIYKQGLSGFTKATDADLNVQSEVTTKLFEGKSSEIKTLVFSIDEPSGFISPKTSYVTVYLPDGLDTISMKSEKGSIVYNSKIKKQNDERLISCDNLHLKTGNLATITIDNNQDILNYYLSTSSGVVMFKTIDNITANVIKFETLSGTLEYTNKLQNATINVRNEFFIKSNKGGIGPQVRVNNFLGNLRIETYNGNFRFNNIGSESSYKKVAITTNSSKINFGSVYGIVSVLSDGDKTSNNINIDYLASGNNINNFDAGEGNVYIKQLNGSSAFNTTSGYIKIDEANSINSIWAHSTTGSIDISYIKSEESKSDSKTTIITNTGSVNVENISNIVNVQVLSDNTSSSVNLYFTAVGKGENKVFAKNKDVNIILVGSSEDLMHRIASKTEIVLPQTGEGVASSKIEGQYDTLKYDYPDYEFNYRIGYSEDLISNHPYLGRGVMLIDCFGTVTVRTA